MSNLRSLQQAPGAFNLISREQNKTKNFLMMFVQADRQPSEGNCIFGLKEDLGAELLYSHADIQDPTTLFRINKRLSGEKDDVWT